MNVTKSFVFLVAAGVAAVFFTWRLDGAYFVMFAFWNIILCAMFFLDALITPGKKFLQIRRQKNKILYFCAENEIFFYVKNNSKYTLDIELKDERVRFFCDDDEYSDLQKWVAPHSEEEFSYVTTPTKRGCFRFEKIFLRYTGIFGLCIKYAEFVIPIEYKVYPDVRDMCKYRLLLQRKLFSREKKFFADDFQNERNLPVYALLDVSRPMSCFVDGKKKLEHAICAALILGDIANKSRDDAGLMVFDSRVRAFVAANRGAAHRNRLLETLCAVEDDRSEADFRGAFRMFREKQKRRSIVFIFTDFDAREDTENFFDDVLFLKKRHFPVVVFMESENADALTKISAKGVPHIKCNAENLVVDVVEKYLGIS